MPFSDKIDKKFLADSILTLEKLLGVTLTIHDHRALLFDAEGKPLLPRRESHTHPYCRIGRYGEGAKSSWDRNCLAECAFQAENAALRELRPFQHHCWKGVLEVVIPVVRNGSPVLILYAGPFRGKEAPPEELTADYAALPEADEERLAGLGRILTLAGQGILRMLEERGEEERNAPPSRKQLIRRYLEDHAHEQATLAGLAGMLNISPSRTSHLVTRSFGQSFQELLLAERMTRARNLLLSTDYPLKEIAHSCGFGTVHYFHRMFRRFYGEPPGNCRKKGVE